MKPLAVFDDDAGDYFSSCIRKEFIRSHDFKCIDRESAEICFAMTGDLSEERRRNRIRKSDESSKRHFLE